MKKVIIAFIPWLFSAFSYKAMAQNENQQKENKTETEEIIIRKKGNKDAHLKIEISGDKVTVNGKPLVEFKDDEITVNKRKIIVRDGDRLLFGDGLRELEGLRSFNWTDDNESGAFLGVTTEKTDKGAKINEVTEESAAAKAGLKEGDIITQLDKTKIDGPESLYNAITAKKPSDEVNVQYLRDGKEKTVKATLQERKNTRGVFTYTMPDGNSKTITIPRTPQVRSFGETRAPRMYGDDSYELFNSYPRQKKLGLKIQDTEEGNGVKVLDVEENSAAANAGVKKDDIITGIGSEQVKNTDEVREQLMENSEKSTYTIKILRNGKEMNYEIKIPKKLKTANL